MVVGNDVLLKCVIPSFEADFVRVGSWLDSEGAEYPADNEMGKTEPQKPRIEIDVEKENVSCVETHANVVLAFVFLNLVHASLITFV